MTGPTALFAGPGAYRTLRPNLKGSDPVTSPNPQGGQTPLCSRDTFPLQMSSRARANPLLNDKGGQTPLSLGWVEVVVGGGAYLAVGGDRLLLSRAGVPVGPLTLVVDRLNDYIPDRDRWLKIPDIKFNRRIGQYARQQYAVPCRFDFARW